MRTKESYQVIRDTANTWIVWRVSREDAISGEYEKVARITLDAGLYYVELPTWGALGIEEWNREPRGWQLKAGAVASVTREKKKAEPACA